MRKLNAIRWLLLPFGLIYGLVMELRNAAFRHDILKSVQFDIPVISIGNLAVGGSGKTPFVKYLIHQLSSKYNVAVLSRGYGRITKGYLVVQADANASNTGDEPLEIKKMFPNNVVCVCEDRVLGIAELLRDFPKTNLILLDDAFQHQYVKPLISIVLSKSKKPFYQDYILPMGRLREFAFNYKRADVVVFTTASQTWNPDIELSKPTFFAGNKYGSFIKVMGNSEVIPNSFLLVTGLADSAQLEHDMREKTEVSATQHFGDHHKYTKSECESLLKKHPHKAWLTTQKDWVKLEPILEKLNADMEVCVIQMDIKMYDEERFFTWLNAGLVNDKS